MMHRAREATGLDDLGDRWFEEPLSGLIALINHEAALESGAIRQAYAPSSAIWRTV